MPIVKYPNKKVRVEDNWYLGENNNGDLILVNSNTGKVVKVIDKETGDEDKKGNSLNNLLSVSGAGGESGYGGLIRGNIFNVLDYDGVYNDESHPTSTTQTLQDIIFDCHTAGGGTIYFPPGIYLLESNTDNAFNASLQLRPEGSQDFISNIHFVGAGLDTILKQNSTGFPFFTNKETANNTLECKNIAFRDMKLQGAATSLVSQDKGIYINQCQNVFCINIHTNSIGHETLRVIKSANIVFRDCVDRDGFHGFLNTSKASASSIGQTCIIDNCSMFDGDVFYEGNPDIIHIHNCSVRGSESGPRIRSANHVTIENNVFELDPSNGARGLFLNNIKRAIVDNNYFKDGQFTGILLKSEDSISENIKITNNIIENFGTDGSALRAGIKLATAGYEIKSIDIVNNRLIDCSDSAGAQDAIILEGSQNISDIKISGNYIRSLNTHDYIIDIGSNVQQALIILNDGQGAYATGFLNDSSVDTITDPVNQDKTEDYNLT